MSVQGSTKRYEAFTLIEMLVVIGIISTLGALTYSAFGGLQNAVKIEQESENIAQDIRNLQRSAMLLERTSNEKWLYGLGIDFSNYEETGEYRIFKWCSQYDSYGNTRTRSEIPDYDDDAGGISIGNGYLPITVWEDSCVIDGDDSATSSLIEYNEGGIIHSTDIDLDPTINSNIRYILFESVSGRTFFYSSDQGELINYDTFGNISSSAIDFEVEMSTKTTTKVIKVKNLSGKISVNVKTDE